MEKCPICKAKLISVLEDRGGGNKELVWYCTRRKCGYSGY